MTQPVDKANPTNYMNNMTPADSTETQITPRDTSAQPNPAAASPTPTTPQPTQPAAQPTTPQPTPQAAPPTPRHLAGRIFDGVLNTLGGGPIYVAKTDPTTGETTRVPVQQTRGQLGKSILAGALAGMFGGMGARDPEGRPDPAQAASKGFQAGTEFHQKLQDKAQQASDEEISRKQMVMKTNLDTAHLVLALNSGKQNMYEKAVAANKNGILKDALAYDQSLTDKSQPKAILQTGLSHDQALAALKGHWSDQLAQIDGYTTNENGDVIPTFTVLNPNVKVKMSEDAAKEFARFNPQYQTAWDDTNGNIQMGLHNYADAQNKLNSLEHMDSLFAQEADKLGLKSTDFADAVKSIGPAGMKAVIEAENAIGGGGTPIDALRRLSLAQGGAQVLAKLGVNGDKINELYNQQIREQKLAEMGGMGKNAPAAADKIKDTADLIDQIADPKIQASFKNRLRDQMNNGELDTLDEKVRDQINKDKEQAMKQGDPATLDAVANLAIGQGDLTQAKDLFSTSKFSPMARVNYDLASAKKATELGLNPTHFTAQAMKEKATLDEQYTSQKNGSVGAQLNSFETYLFHNADAVAASNEWKRTNSEFWNTPLNELEKKFGNDPTFIKFKASLIAPGKEFMNFLNSNRAEHEADIKAVETITNVNMPPARIQAALQQLAKTADDRAASLGDSYVGVVGTTYRNLLSPAALATLQGLGIKSRAAAYSGELPRNPEFAANPSVGTMKTLQKGNPSDVAIFKRFGAAAGNDFNRAVALAREHGYIIPTAQ